jgi:hypothetical protein
MLSQGRALQVASTAGRSSQMFRRMGITVGRNWSLTSNRKRTINALALKSGGSGDGGRQKDPFVTVSPKTWSGFEAVARAISGKPVDGPR